MAKAPKSTRASQPDASVSWRLSFRYDGGNVELVKQQRVAMVPPPATEARLRVGQNAGTWIEIRDANSKVLYARHLRDPFGTIAERHSPEGRPRMFMRSPTQGVFDVVVPALPEARVAAIVSDAPSRGAMPAKELGRFPLGRGKEGQE